MPATYKVNDRRSSSGYIGSDNLFKASRANEATQRTRIYSLNRDTKRNLSAFGRQQMVTIGRWLFANCPALRGAILEMANCAASSWIPQFYGDDKAWGGRAEEWLYEHDKICDVRGWPYTMATYRRNLVISLIRDGDMGTLLVGQDEAGNSAWPFIQTIPCHRVGGGTGTSRVEGGLFDGAHICDGIISNDYGRTIGCRVFDPEDTERFTDYSANDLFLSYMPEYADQIRGFSAIAAALFDFQDITESRSFELLAQKVASTISLIEENETGEVDTAKSVINAPATEFNANGTKAELPVEVLDGGTIRYFKAGTNSKLSSFSYDRPGMNSQAFEDRVMRAAFAGMNWSTDFSLDPTKAGGAQMRVVIEKVNRAICAIQDHVLLPAIRRIDTWRLAKAIKLGLLPANDQWYQFDYQGPAKLTADEKYSSDVDLQEMDAGASTLARVAGKRGNYWEDVRRQKEIEADDLLTRAGVLAKKHKVTMEMAIMLLSRTKTTTTTATITNEPEPKPE